MKIVRKCAVFSLDRIKKPIGLMTDWGLYGASQEARRTIAMCVTCIIFQS